MFRNKYLNTLWRMFVAAVSFGAPVVFLKYPGLENITIGTVVFGILHFAEKRITS